MKRPDLDRLAELEEERRFLLRSLADLDRERAAGDVDEADYTELRDGYTVRAAAALREIEDGRAALPAKQPANWARRVLAGVATLALIALVGWALAASNSQRLPGQSVSGADPRDRRQTLLAEARLMQQQDFAAAAEIYGEVLAEWPDDVEALTYRGWTSALVATDAEALTAAIDDLTRAAELDPAYPDAWCFRGIITYRFLEQPDLAAGDLEQCLAFNPPASVRGLVEAMLEGGAGAPVTNGS